MKPKINFKFIVNKWANFYFFVQNLSEWHFSNRKEYNEAWRNELGNFSQDEENILLEFRKIRQSYPDSKSIFEIEISRRPEYRYFMPFDLMWHEIVHLFFEKKYIYPLIKEITKNYKGKIGHNTRESLINSFFPRGVLGMHFFNLPKAQRLHNKIEIDTDKLLDIAQDYFKNKKRIDEKFTIEVIDMLMKYNNYKVGNGIILD